MATSTGEKEHFEDLLTCTICLETLKVPKYLPCLHTFCETCIHTYIVSSAMECAEGFKCPVCRCRVAVGENGGEPETWAKALPGNHFVLSLIDKRAIKKAEKLCNACELDNKRQSAVSWCKVCEEAYCETCTKYHKLFIKALAKHEIVSFKDINDDKDNNMVVGLVACDAHPDKIIEIYCKDHSKPCCTVCATVHHRKCEQVVTIDNAVSGVKESTKAKELSKKLEETSTKLGEILQNRKQNIVTFKSESDIVLEEIGKLRENINKHLDEIEQKLRDEMHRTQKHTVLKLNDEITELSSLKSAVDNWKKIFEASLKQGSEIQCLVKLEEILKKIPKFDNEFCSLVREMKDASVAFKPNDVIANVKSLGRIDITESFSLHKFNFDSGNVKVLFTIEVDVSKSGYRHISGIFFNNDIILTDYINYRIISYDDKGIQKGEVKMSHRPLDITMVNDRTVAVSTGSNKVYLININKFTIDKILTIGANACLVEDEYIAVSSGTISWINATTGAKIRDFTTGVSTRFITSSHKNKYIYMDSDSSIKCVSTEGNSFTYQNSQLESPFCQDTDCVGNIYTTGYSSKNIHQLTSDGRLVRIIPISDLGTTITDYPWVIRFQKDSNRFLLTFNNTGKVLICQID